MFVIYHFSAAKIRSIYLNLEKDKIGKQDTAYIQLQYTTYSYTSKGKVACMITFINVA